MKEVRIMKENITYYLVWIICLLAGCAPTPKQIEDTTDPIPMYPDYTDIMIPTNIALYFAGAGGNQLWRSVAACREQGIGR